jgi:hypothetical protein
MTAPRRFHPQPFAFAVLLSAVGFSTPVMAQEPAVDLTPLKKELRAHIAGAQTPGTGDAETRQTSLRRLRARAQDFTKAAREMYRESRREDYLHRWSLVHTMGELATPAAAEALAEIATSPLPAATEPGGHDSSPNEEEGLIRMRAVSGLARLARSGDPDARAALKRCLASPDRAARATAVHEWLDSAAALGQTREDVRREIAARLTPADAWMLSLRAGRLETDGHIVPSAESAPKKRHRDDAAGR